ncbi:MAG TPA: D-alanine--D-alanine ligase family protein [Acidimicrobiia bacterium]
MARVLLLFGGRSAEHEVSCVSAVSVADALAEGGHRVIPVGIDRSGDWFLADAGERPLRAEGRRVTLSLPGGSLVSGEDEVGFDVAFPVLHGPYGEDGRIQGAFDMAGVPYVGCGVLGSAVAMDKDVAKRLARDAGIATTRWQMVRHADLRDDAPAVVDEVAGLLGFPVFVKPAELGSSIGVAKASTDAELKDALLRAFELSDKALVEETVTGREIEVGVLEGPRASAPGEIVIEAEWYDYEAKYNDDASRFVAPARLTRSQVATVQQLACRAFEALECRGLARVDFFFEKPGRGFILNEVNTMPGFTPISGFPLMWQASGMSYPELCNELVELALGG